MMLSAQEQKMQQH
ncbi:UNVERIFIED_CONTAM: hypothetical protein GTU68_001892 [Idotea baltica]|nr:hypothetical protein [Idotea baltica]